MKTWFRALVAILVGVPACSSSPPLALTPCGPEAGVQEDDGGEAGPDSRCPHGLICMTFSAPAADGLCGSGGPACVLPCTTDADCAPLGKDVSCSPQCGTSVCTPFQ